jgi:DNA-binding beta-propeller fold protein YncE
MTSRSSSRLLALLAAAMLLQVWVGCDLLGTSGEKKAPSIPEKAVLAASMVTDESGLWIFDSETLQRKRIVKSLSGDPPSGMIFSPDGRRLYLTWSKGPPTPGGITTRVLARLDTRTWEIKKRRTLPDTSRGSASLVYDSTRAQIIAYGRNDGVVEFYDAETLEPKEKLPLAPEEVDAVALAPNRDVLYFDARSDSGHQVQVYDPDTRTITGRLRLTDDPTLQQSAHSDLALSPDERFLYATTYLSPGGPGRFYMVDLESGEAVFEGPAGGYSNLAVHPGGRYVYIDCPAGGWRELTPTNQILRFDREAREMEVFIDGGGELGLPYEGLIADEITMLPGGEAFVIRNPIPARTQHEEDDPELPSLLQVDTETGDVHATYVPPRDEQGYVYPSAVGRMWAGVVPK